jgi:hypothetical protein
MQMDKNEPRGLPWYAQGQFVIRTDGTSVCKVNGMEYDAKLIAESVNAKYGYVTQASGGAES